ncbi:letm1 [Symbiodinium natans]|uniref:Letm1 protein n=1 Tax=Symbiodinium natans TaxID=878477 RepID=A0A812IBJ8_9DINO|nr:letm1 [Symbiodinium natans]
MLPRALPAPSARPFFARDCPRQDPPRRERFGGRNYGSAAAMLAIGFPLASKRQGGRRSEEAEGRPKSVLVSRQAPWVPELSTSRGQLATFRTASVSDCRTSSETESSQDAETLTPAAASESISKRLKDMVFVKDMRAAMTSGEFALRLRGAERPGLVDYEGLYNVLEGFAGRLSELEASEVLRDEDAWKAEEDLKLIQGKLKDRVVEMTQDTRRYAVLGEDGANSGSGEQDQGSSLNAKAASQARNKFMLYLRGDQMVDIDTALQDSQAEQPFSRDLWERLEGKAQHSEDEWSPYENAQAEGRISQKQLVLQQAKQDLKSAKANRAKVLRRMKKVGSKGSLDKKSVELTCDLFRWDRLISGHQVLVLLANVDLIFHQVSAKLEKLLLQADIAEWDHSGRRLKRLVLKLSALEVQVAPYRKYVHEKPEQVVQMTGLDWDELQMLEEQIAAIAQNIGLHVDRIGQRGGFFAPIRRQMLSFTTSWQKIRRGIVFQANGIRLLSQDLRLALKLLLKVVFLNHALEDREVRICRRAVKDLLVLVPFLILLLIPLSPPGHMLVFSLILKVYPDFLPSPFTEHRQNVMRIYNAIKPVSEKSDYGSWS